MILVWLIVIPFAGGLFCWQAERLGDKADAAA
jgi:NADH-quinone oxidoreductase subunit M